MEEKMLHANLLNTEDIDPNAFRHGPFQSACLQLSALRKKGSTKWTPQQVKEKLMEIATEGAEGEEDSVIEDMFDHGVSLSPVVLELARREQLTCYVLCGRRLADKIAPPNRNNNEPLVFAEWDGRWYLYTGVKTKEKVAHMAIRPPREVPKTIVKTDRFISK